MKNDRKSIFLRIFSLENILIHEVISILLISGIATEIFSAKIYYSWSWQDIDMIKIFKLLFLALSVYFFYPLESELKKINNSALDDFKSLENKETEEELFIRKLLKNKRFLATKLIFSFIFFILYIFGSPLLGICFN